MWYVVEASREEDDFPELYLIEAEDEESALRNHFVFGKRIRTLSFEWPPAPAQVVARFRARPRRAYWRL